MIPEILFIEDNFIIEQKLWSFLTTEVLAEIKGNGCQIIYILENIFAEICNVSSSVLKLSVLSWENFLDVLLKEALG